MNIHFTHTVYSIVRNTNTFLQGTNCMEKFCADLKKRHATEIINYEKKEKLPLTDG